jgi:hypothetical protein
MPVRNIDVSYDRYIKRRTQTGQSSAKITSSASEISTTLVYLNWISQPEYAEALALRRAVILAKEERFYRVVFASVLIVCATSILLYKR